MPNALLILLLSSLPVSPSPSARAIEPLRREVAALEAKAALAPRDPASWKDLTIGLRRLARSSGDATFEAKAWEAIASALALAPRDPEALALKAWVQAARHDFEGALIAARESVALAPRDSFGHAVLADALTELGRYPEAVTAVEAMMRLKPGAAAYSRAAHLRSLHGDREGAIRLMEMTVDASGAADPEALAWAHVMLGREHQGGGAHEVAQRHYRRALAIFPAYHLALFHLGDSLAAQGELRGARTAFEQLHAAAPTAVTAASLGAVYLAEGDRPKAESLFAEVDAAARLADPALAEPRWLARYYADRRQNLEASIALVREELKTHQDVETWDGLAWALHRAGRHEEALAASDRATALGTMDSRLLYHRGLILIGAGRDEEGRAALDRALALRNLWPAERAEAEQASRGPRASGS